MNPLTTPLFVKDLLEHDRKIAHTLFGTTSQATDECELAIVNYKVGHVFSEAALVGNRGLVEWALERGETRMNGALYWACRGGHRDLAEWSVQRGADDLHYALAGASWNGHRDLAEWAVEKGAKTLNWALWVACGGGHRDLAEWLVEKGATFCQACCGVEHEFPPRE